MHPLKKPKILVSTIVTVLVVVFFTWRTINKKDTGFRNLVNQKPSYEMDVDAILNMVKNGNNSVLKVNEVVEIEGAIKEINFKNDRITVYLGATSDYNASVICDMQKNQKEKITKLNINDKVKLKGVFKGYLANAIFLNCIISETNYE